MFQPIGDQARWRLLYEILRELDYDEQITYERMAEALDVDPVKDRGTIQVAMYRAAKELSLVNDRSIESVRGVGYRVVTPEEHVSLSRRQQRRSGRALTRAQRHVQHVDLSQMSPEGRSIVHAVSRALTWQQEAMRRLDIRQRDLEQVTKTVAEQGRQTAEETAENSSQLAKLEARLAQLEKTSGD